MTTQEGHPLSALWHMVRRNTVHKRSWYEGRIFLELPAPADAKLVAWCKAQDFVTFVCYGGITPASLAIVLGEAAEYDHVMRSHIYDFLRALSSKTGLVIEPKSVTTWDYQWREGQKWLFTPEMQFLTDNGANVPRAGILATVMYVEGPGPTLFSFPRSRGAYTGIDHWIDPAMIVPVPNPATEQNTSHREG